MPKITVLMNCLNGERFVREAIESVYAQAYHDWEIVFWDNASTDRTAEIAKSFDGRLRYFRSTETVPLGKARQWALAEAKGEWVAVLDHDDLLLPLRFQRQMEEIAKGDYVLSYCGYKEINEQGAELRTVIPRNQSGWLMNALLEDFEINIATVMMRRDILQHLKMETIAQFKMAEDYYLYLGLVARGQVCVVREVLVKYRQVASSWSERALDRHAVEFHETLDQLERDMPGITERHGAAFAHARAHATYAECKYLMHVGQHRKAQRLMASIRSMRRAYSILYRVSYFPWLWNLIHRRDVKAKLTSLLLSSR